MNNGQINTSTAEMLLYSVATLKGHSGDALLLRGEDMIGLRGDGHNDHLEAQRETSPTVRGVAVRLDIPVIKEAVEAAKAVRL